MGSQHNTKVLVAMSGGVDSSVAAALLREQGYDVTGIFMCLGTAGGSDASQGCCSPQDAADARRVAEHLGIDLYVLNLAGEFEPIIDYFVQEYVNGRTPNPCILCNARIKFGRLIQHADALGARYVATGHYARVATNSPSTDPSVLAERANAHATPCVGSSSVGTDCLGTAVTRGLARAKDQSYALFGVDRRHLGRILLPIGEFADKAAVRAKARELGLLTHDKPDSQEICFVPDDDYVELLRRRAPEALTPGDVVDAAGNVLGRHEGYARFTIGQRKGVRIAGKEPMYVTAIDPAAARVTLGNRQQVMVRRLWARSANWHADVTGEFDATVQIRYNHSGAAARVTVTGPDTFEAQFAEPVSAITPGQAAVVYLEDRMLGGGWIERAE